MIYANVFADGHSANSLFAEHDSVHRHNPTHTPRLLRQAFLDLGVELNTADVNADRPIAFELHLEGRALEASTTPRYFIAQENPNINPLNASAQYCAPFRKAFVWDPRLFHLPNVVPILIPHTMQAHDFPAWEKRDLFSCLINANKAFKHPLPSDLYVERLNTIRWHEQHAPEHFHLYGLGWDKSTPAFDVAGKLRRSVSRLKTRLFGIPPFPSYRGEVLDKATVLRRAKFSYCYENSRDLSNYITEKIFDSLVCGCVPIYWGADNVLEHIPAGCFVDRRQFDNTAQVHRHLLTISSSDYAAYQKNIRDFLQSKNAIAFSSERFAHVVANNVCDDLKTLVSERRATPSTSPII